MFPRGKAKFVPADFAPTRELPDEDYPLVLHTGRVLQHWHTRTMTRRAKALDEIAPEALLEMAPEDMQALGVVDGEFVRVVSRRGEVTVKATRSHKPSRGSVFLPFHFKEAAANLLMIDTLNPYGRIPEFTFCAVRVEQYVLHQVTSLSPRERAEVEGTPHRTKVSTYFSSGAPPASLHRMDCVRPGGPQSNPVA